MKKSNEFLIENDVFSAVYEHVETLSETLFVLTDFCEHNKYSENFNKIIPTLKYLKNESSQLFAYFINKRYATVNEKISFKM